jgi:hypothetical protein
MTETLRVRVEQRHLCAGRATSCTRCPIALALCEQHPIVPLGEWEVFSPDAIRVEEDGSAYYYRLPPSAARFVRDFDAGREVEPFEFTMERYQ